MGGSSLAARRILDLLQIEHCRHGGKENGKLVLTYDQMASKMDRHAIAPAIRELVALGFVEITQQGRGGNAEFRIASKYRLTYLARLPDIPTNEWRRVATLEDAIVLVTPRVLRNSPSSSDAKNQNPVWRLASTRVTIGLTRRKRWS